MPSFHCLPDISRDVESGVPRSFARLAVTPKIPKYISHLLLKSPLLNRETNTACSRNPSFSRLRSHTNTVPPQTMTNTRDFLVNKPDQTVVNDHDVMTEDENELRSIHFKVAEKRHRKKNPKAQPWKKGDKPYEYVEEDGDSKSAGG